MQLWWYLLIDVCEEKQVISTHRWTEIAGTYVCLIIFVVSQSTNGKWTKIHCSYLWDAKICWVSIHVQNDGRTTGAVKIGLCGGHSGTPRDLNAHLPADHLESVTVRSPAAPIRHFWASRHCFDSSTLLQCRVPVSRPISTWTGHPLLAII
jgi:hypothetical protein